MKRAFTLIELLVVIAIIAILAAILFPVFARAKMAAKKTQELSQMKQIGTATQIYLADYDDTYMQGYYYPNNNGSATDGNGVGGYVHWSGVLMPYVKNLNIFVSPGDPTGGMAPTCYVGNNQGWGAPGGQTPQGSCSTIQDIQVPRISYTANAMIMPRKRRTADPMNTISSTVLDDIAGTIMIAPQTHYPTCINGSSSASGVAFKTHRPANGILINDGAPLTATFFQGEAAAEVGHATYLAVTYERSKRDIDDCRTGTAVHSGNYSHMTYVQPDRWENGANYVFSDTHAKFSAWQSTLDPNSFKWGKRAYTAGGGVIVRADGVTPVN